MIRPIALKTEERIGPWSCRGTDTWEMLQAAAAGETEVIRRLLALDGNLVRTEYWYTQPIQLAVREGHTEAVRALLDAGADPDASGLAEDLVITARDRGYREVEGLLEAARLSRERVRSEPAGGASKLHEAARRDDVEGARALLDEEPESLDWRDETGATPLHTAVAATARGVLALLLERGADPNAPEGAEAPRGVALHAAARLGDRKMVEALLARGADPNAEIDSSGSATFAARTPELRSLLIEAGGHLDAADLIWLGEDDEAVDRVSRDPATASQGCGGVLAAACRMGKRRLLVRLLAAGARVPRVLTECRSYLLLDPAMLELLLESGMDPDLPDWQYVTPLHDLCGRDSRGRPRPHRRECAGILLAAGANLTARDEAYRSTPLAWAARNDLPDMVEWLLDRGAPVRLAQDPLWARPLAWAERRGSARCVELLQAAGEASDPS